MAVAAYAEQLDTQYWEPEIIAQPPELPLIIAVPEMLEDELARKRAERLIRSVAERALTSQVEEIPQTFEAERPVLNLMDGIHRAAAGDETARKQVEKNAYTDAIERTLKEGHMTSVDLEEDEQGNILQHGQQLASVHKNTLLYASDNPKMRRRAEAETRNAYRLDLVNRAGMLEEYAFVVFSRTADDMSLDELKRARFFTETMSLTAQVTTKEDGVLTLESAFSSGVDEAGNRIDRKLVAGAGEVLGVDLDKGATETIDTPLLIHKSLLPNGAADLQWLLDGLSDKQQTSAHYLGYRDACAEREKDFAPKVRAIVADLIAESHNIKNPLEAIERLDKISEAHMVEKAVEDMSIDSAVFGREAAWHIEHARWLEAHGDTAAAEKHMEKAKAKAQSSSCPSGASKSNSSESGGNASPSSPSSESGGEQDDCEFVSKQCPKCKKKNVKTVVKKGRYYGSCGCKS